MLMSTRVKTPPWSRGVFALILCVLLARLFIWYQIGSFWFALNLIMAEGTRSQDFRKIEESIRQLRDNSNKYRIIG